MRWCQAEAVRGAPLPADLGPAFLRRLQGASREAATPAVTS